MGEQFLKLIDFAFMVYFWLILIWVLLSWIPNAKTTPFGEFLRKLVEPYLSIFRRIIPPLGGMIDISPIVAILCLHFIKIGLVQVLEWLFTSRM